MNRGSAGRVMRVAIVLAAVHSALAARQTKALAARIMGARYRNGLYRAFYCLQSTIMFGWATIWFFRLPDHVLYRVAAPWSWLMRLGQAASLVLLWQSGRAVGISRLLGLSSLAQLRAGSVPEPEPEAQGPRLGQDGELLVAGPFRYTRHAANLTIFGVVWLEPRITVNWLAMAIMSSIYAVVGSLHEESRLRRTYGAQYARYQQQVPFLFPGIPHAERQN